MPKRSIAQLKEWFRKGLKPLETQFADWLDSYWHKDATDIPISSISGLQNALNNLLSQSAIDGLIGGAPSNANTLNKLYNLINSLGEFAGNHDASTGLPTTGSGASGAIDKGDYWYITTPGTIAGLGSLAVGDVLFSKVAGANTAANFFYLPFATLVADASTSVKGIVQLDTDANIQSNTNAGRVVTSGNLAGWWTWIRTQTFNFSGAWTFISNVFTFGDGTNGNKTLRANTAATNKPELRWNNSLSRWEFSTDGITFQPFGSLSVSAGELAAIPSGETNLFTVAKSIDGSTITYGANVQQVDNFITASLATLLADTAAWVQDRITITGDNLTGALGQTAQEFVPSNDRGHIYKCVSHVTGTNSSNGSATWMRTRSQDNLTPGVAQDDAIITQLTTEAGWNAVDNVKVVTTRSRIGTWYRGTSGYFYACISEVAGSSWTWIRIGQPDTIPIDISDATLIAELQANNWTTTPILTPVAAVKGEDMQRHYWETAGPTPNLAVCINKGTAKWIKLR